jgi:DNA-binding response OmpR family regulator
MNGQAFVQAVRSVPAVAGIPILMMTVRRDAETVTAAVKIGVNGYLVKPFTGAELMEKVARLLKYRAGA